STSVGSSSALSYNCRPPDTLRHPIVTSTLPHQAPILERKAMSVREFVARIWPHCRTRRGAVAMILVGCAIEVAFFWVVPLSFRSLIDNAIGPRDRQHLINIVSVLAIGIVVTSIASI